MTGTPAITRADDSGACKTTDDTKLLSCPSAKLIYIECCAVERATNYSQVFVKLYCKGRTEYDAPELVDALLERLDVALVGLSALLFERLS